MLRTYTEHWESIRGAEGAFSAPLLTGLQEVLGPLGQPCTLTNTAKIPQTWMLNFSLFVPKKTNTNRKRDKHKTHASVGIKN